MWNRNTEYRFVHLHLYWQRALRKVLVVVLSFIAAVNAGCSPELMAGSALLISHLHNVEKQNRSSDKAQQQRRQPRPQAVTRTSRPETTVREPISGSATDRQAAAVDDTARCRRLLQQAGRAYDDLIWDSAQSLLRDLISQCKDKNIRAQGLIILGAIVYQQGDTEQAARYFRQSGRIAPDIGPSQELFSPHVVRFYEQTLQRKN